MLSISLLGDFRISQDDLPVTGINKPRLQSLLAYLVLHRHACLSRAHLAFLFWPDTNEAQARTNLRNLLYNLRLTLPDVSIYLESGVQTLQWRNSTAFVLDVALFEAELAQADRARQANNFVLARKALERAVDLYKGDLLPNCYDDWIIPLREDLRRAYLRALQQLILILEQLREYPSAIDYALRILQQDPLHEATYRCLIRLHALNGERAAALRVYHTCVTILRRELDVEPTAATREAYEQLLGAEQGQSQIPTTIPISPLVGRIKEWAQILEAWHAVIQGRASHLVVLNGEAGIGKTRLIEELLQWAAHQGITIASTRCYAAEGNLAYAPVITWLRANPLASLKDVWLVEIARLLPEILARWPDLPRPASLTEAWQRQRLFEALSLAVLGIHQPLLFTIDDLHWCDRDTAEWLHFLLRFDTKARLLIVGSYRPEEIGENHPLVSLLQMLRVDGRVTEIELQPLDEAATRFLAEQVAGGDFSDDISRRLFQETEGNPLFVVEMVRAGIEAPRQEVFFKQSDEYLPNLKDLPAKVQSVLETRLLQVSPPTRKLLGVAATIGREFSLALLREAGGCDEESMVRALDELWQRRIIREHGQDGYDFSHDKLREVAYWTMSSARRRLMHRQIAQALQILYAAELDSISHQLAAHYEHAGLPRQAIPFYLRAAEVAGNIYANEEAIFLLRRGIALEDVIKRESANGQDHKYAVQLWEYLGDILERRAQHEEALQAYQEAKVRLHSVDTIWSARIYRKMAAALREQRSYHKALDACQQAEMMLGRQPENNNSHWWAEWLEVQLEQVWAYYWLAKWPEMDALVKKSEPVVQHHSSTTSRMRYLLASCLMHLRRERYSVSDEMLANSQEALTLSLEWGSLKTRLECQFELGFLHLWRRDLDEAETHLQAAHAQAETYQVMPFRTLALTYLTIVHRFQGHIDEVSSFARHARQSAEEALMPDYVAAAMGNQAWLAWRRKDMLTAMQYGKDAMAIWQHSPLVYPFQWQALWPLIATAFVQGQEENAWEYIRLLLEPTQQQLIDTLNSTLVAAQVAKSRGEVTSSHTYLNHAMQVAEDLGYL
jgi:DNA-binding SARP family transcriptional activator